MLKARDERSGTSEQNEAVEAAVDAGLAYVSDEGPGIRREVHGKKFRYRSGRRLVRDAPTLARIRHLVIPPAWTDVWICPSANGHIQATGRDARGRKQYRYHARWSEVRDGAKYERLIAFGRQLPKLRRTVKRHMAEQALSKRRVLATLVHLLETTLIRVGNAEYARANKSFGLTTLQDRHVSFSGSEIRFHFKGKTGKEWRLKMSNRRVAKIMRSCQELPGQHLFQYEEEDGSIGQITSSDVNAYLREIAGENVTAKDFRTWAGTVLAAMALAEFEAVSSEAAAKRNIRAAIEAVAARLGNTVSVCRKCYVHPEVLDCYLEGTLIETLRQNIRREIKRDLAGLPPEEAATLALLHHRLTPPRTRQRTRRPRPFARSKTNRRRKRS